MSMKEEDKRAGDPPAFINLKVVGQDDSEVLLRMKRDVALKKVMNAYCDRKQVECYTYVFLFDGARIKEEHTAAQLGMEDGNEIHAFLHHDGGGRNSSPLFSPTNSASY